MPREANPLSAEEIGLLRSWIAAGASAPADEQPDLDPKQHWAFQPSQRPALPLESATASTPIDALLGVALRERGLAPVGAAPRHVLLRRVHLDLVGLPPTRDELAAFAADDRPDSHERVVDKLLASPQYGERWARHWMDVWRYSDWYGRRSVPDVMNSYPQIWRWRDWIVRSLNGDQGYDQMVLEMLAADELWPDDPDRVVATGFIVRNWFKWNYDTWMRDQVEHTGKAFLGLTLQCALCHDHKYDPISQEEYFRFRAIFEPLELRHDRLPGLPDPGPFKKYVYADSYGPIAAGMIRVFDEKPDAATFMYRGGDQRSKIEGRSAVPPGVPALLAGERFAVQPIDLPPRAFYPGLQPFVQREERARRQQSVVAAEAAFAASRSPAECSVSVARLKAAKAELASIKARTAADNARYGITAADAASLAKSAGEAEYAAKLASAEAEVAAAEQALAEDEAQPESEKRTAAVQATQSKLALARQTLASVEADAAKDNLPYTPLSPVYPSQSTGRRAALARWIADRQNPLTARVAVNHVWRWHFSRPLVETTANFGRNGKPASHPALLDWLAVELMDRQWSLKRISRELVTSDAYRQASDAPPDYAARLADPDNRWYWRANAGRMEAEVLRDSLLGVAGELDQAIGGQEIDHAEGITSRRRSLYFAHHDESKMELLELFDAASPTDCYERTTSIRPQQALALANSELTRQLARLLAGRLNAELPADGPFIDGAFAQVLSRPATSDEAAAATRFLAGQQAIYLQAATAGDRRLRSRESLIHVLLNHHDFVTIR